MKAAVSASAVLLLAALQPQPAQAQSVRELINQVIAAEGGVEALRALKAPTIKADAMHWEPGQSKVAEGERHQPRRTHRISRVADAIAAIANTHSPLGRLNSAPFRRTQHNSVPFAGESV
jgi:hypothetical protein